MKLAIDHVNVAKYEGSTRGAVQPIRTMHQINVQDKASHARLHSCIAIVWQIIDSRHDSASEANGSR